MREGLRFTIQRDKACRDSLSARNPAQLRVKSTRWSSFLASEVVKRNQGGRAVYIVLTTDGRVITPTIEKADSGTYLNEIVDRKVA
jgi:hypothetical protein